MRQIETKQDGEDSSAERATEVDALPEPVTPKHKGLRVKTGMRAGVCWLFGGEAPRPRTRLG